MTIADSVVVAADFRRYFGPVVWGPPKGANRLALNSPDGGDAREPMGLNGYAAVVCSAEGISMGLHAASAAGGCEGSEGLHAGIWTKRTRID